MTRPRKEQVCIDDTPYYHIVSRCVRRAYLCGSDTLSGKCYEHRRSWIENRIRLLASIFGIDILAYSVMPNHLHMVIRLCPNEIDCLSAKEVAQRWTCLFKGPLIIQSWLKGDSLDRLQCQTVDDFIHSFRRKLQDLGWFMKCLNEPIARSANKEDNCTGHFWEGRYKSQALLSEEALLSCMTYVDLNPVRAGIAKTPESSDFTSIKERLAPRFNLKNAINDQVKLEAIIKFDLPLKPLLQFEQSIYSEEQNGILFSFKDYLKLLDFTGRAIRNDKRGSIPGKLPPILSRLSLSPDVWLNNASKFECRYHTVFSKRKMRYKKPA